MSPHLISCYITGNVILQTPLYVYEGDDITIRCHLRPGYNGGLTMWYKENRVIRGWTDYAEYLIRKVDSNTAGTYKCEKDVGPYGGKYYDQSSISVEELFTTPTIKVWGHQVEGGNMTLTCETNIPPPRRNTQLQVTFYREGWIVRRSGVSDIYEVYNVQLEHSGKYSCEVKTTDGRVRKRSAERVIQIEDNMGYTRQNIIRLTLSGCVIIAAALLVFYHING
ncbi:Fc receptor-like A [Dendropsophus ebraccatus]|uniref:Fc receptor-like A n=1 Tax=Dendropsophus ebraccatus TaxID=150705 RepID=UPI0038313824